MTNPSLNGFTWTIIAIAVLSTGVWLGVQMHVPNTVSHELPIAEASGQMLGGTTYSGRTTLTFNGNMGGIHGMNTKCQVNYPNSHVCSQGEILASGVTSISGTGWIVCDLLSSPTSCHGVTDTVVSVTNTLCSSYTISTGTGGVTLDAAGTLAVSACNVNNSIHCCI